MKPDEALRLLNHFHGELTMLYHDASQRLGISDSAMRILYAISELGEPCALSDVVQLSELSKQTVNSALRNLEKDGVLYLEASGARSKRICLTAKGERLRDATAHRLMEMERKVLSAWPQEEMQRHVALTQRFVQDFRPQVDQLGNRIG